MAGNFLTRAITTILLPPFCSLFLLPQRTSKLCEKQIHEVKQPTSVNVYTVTSYVCLKLTTSLCLAVTGEVSTRKRPPGHSASCQSAFPIHTFIQERTADKTLIIISSTDKVLYIDSKSKDNNLSAGFCFDHPA